MTQSGDVRVKRRHLLLIVVLLIVVVFAGWRALGGDSFTNSIEDQLLDLRFMVRGEIAAPQDFVILAIDSTATDQLGWSPPPRGAIAKAIDIVMSAGPKVLAIDLLFLDKGQEDEPLRMSLEAAGDIVLGTAVMSGVSATSVKSPALDTALERSAFSIVIQQAITQDYAPRLLAPRDDFLNNTRLAHVSLSEGADRVARRVPLAAPVGGLYLPALGLESARQFADLEQDQVVLEPGRQIRFGTEHIKTDQSGRVIINHYGVAGSLKQYGLMDVLNARIPPSVFAGRAVFLGVTDESFLDVFATPFGAKVPGVEVMATLAANVAYDEVLLTKGVASAINLLAPAVLALLIGVAGSFLSAPAVVLVGAAVWAIGLGLIQLPFTHGNLVVDAVSLLFALSVSTALAILLVIRRERRMRRAIGYEHSNLVRYVSPMLATELAKNTTPRFDQRDQMAAVLFADVKGYTSLAESLVSADASALVKNIHQFFEQCAEKHDGVIISFEGDGAMICFGLPDPADDDASRALLCGQALVEGIGSVRVPKQPNVNLTLRIGGHFGPVTAAVVGGARQAHVTLSGDTVNVASRFQGVAKSNAARFVVSRSLLEAALRQTGTGPASRAVRLEVSALRGRKEEIETWSL
jgi:adenylate cyclase